VVSARKRQFDSRAAILAAWSIGQTEGDPHGRKTCRSFATISSGLSFFCGITDFLQKLESLFQGGPLLRAGQPRDDFALPSRKIGASFRIVRATAMR